LIARQDYFIHLQGFIFSSFIGISISIMFSAFINSVIAFKCMFLLN
jgi:hypothetical protein